MCEFHGVKDSQNGSIRIHQTVMTDNPAMTNQEVPVYLACSTNWQRGLCYISCTEKKGELSDLANHIWNGRNEKHGRVASLLPVPEFLWGRTATCSGVGKRRTSMACLPLKFAAVCCKRRKSHSATKTTNRNVSNPSEITLCNQNNQPQCIKPVENHTLQPKHTSGN